MKAFYFKNKSIISNVTLLIFIILMCGLMSCSKKIVFTDNNKTVEFKIKGDIVIDDTHFYFKTKKGTNQYVPLDYFYNKLKNDSLTVKVD